MGIRGTTQEISNLIYPHKNIYYIWEEMKNEYEEHKRWLHGSRLKRIDFDLITQILIGLNYREPPEAFKTNTIPSTPDEIVHVVEI